MERPLFIMGPKYDDDPKETLGGYTQRHVIPNILVMLTTIPFAQP